MHVTSLTMAPSVLAEGTERGAKAPPPMSFYYKKSNYLGRLGEVLKQTLIYVKPESIMDVGTFRGDVLTNILAQKYPATRLYGVDLSHHALFLAEKLVKRGCEEMGANPTLSFHQANVNALPFPDQSVDLLLTHGCLIHVNHDEIPTALKECLRVAKHCLFVESSCDAQDAKTTQDATHAKRYWEMRARYYSTDMMSPRLKARIEKMPYYYSHAYPKLLKSLKAKIIDTVLISEVHHTMGYLVKGRS